MLDIKRIRREQHAEEDPLQIDDESALDSDSN